MPPYAVQPTDMSHILTFLVELLNTPSPTGYTAEAIEYVERAFRQLNLPPETTFYRTPKGALQITLKGRTTEQPRALTAHVDTLGLMVKQIKPSGRLKCTRLNGVMWSGAEFEGVTVRTHQNQRVRGTLVPVNGSTHVNRQIHDSPRDENTLEVRLDARTTSEAKTRQLGIEVGDFVFLDPRVEVSESGFIRSRFLDDKLSVACLYGALMLLDGQAPAHTTTLLISNYEEVGHGGADSLPTNLFEYVVVDMAAIGEGQQSDEFSCTLCIKDSTGPYSFELNNRLRDLATAHNIPLKIDIYPHYGSDGSAYWSAGGTARVALIGPGVDSSHSYERSHQDAITATTQLIHAYLLAD